MKPAANRSDPVGYALTSRSTFGDRGVAEVHWYVHNGVTEDEAAFSNVPGSRQTGLTLVRSRRPTPEVIMPGINLLVSEELANDIRALPLPADLMRTGRVRLRDFYFAKDDLTYYREPATATLDPFDALLASPPASTPGGTGPVYFELIPARQAELFAGPGAESREFLYDPAQPLKGPVPLRWNERLLSERPAQWADYLLLHPALGELLLPHLDPDFFTAARLLEDGSVERLF